MEFKDHFSARAALYSQYRPGYPGALFHWVASLVARHDVVWDCATGSGQAATGLANYFTRVIATDASKKQISMAAPHPSIDYRVATAYESGLDDESVDAVTVAQAIHWLDHDRFYREAKRVMREDAAIVIWSYGDPVVDDPQLHDIVHAFNRGTIERYWRPERKVILAALKTIPFPFREIAAPPFTLEQSWTLAEFAGYMRTWSATAAFVEQNGVDPVAPVESRLRPMWGGGKKSIRWPIYIRAGY
jgi:ubiquinone/menaquinone biosynthesis C-methylase UbiE